MEKEESRRIHQDYWEKCRTCRWWYGNRSGVGEGTCTNERSEINRDRPTARFINTFADGHCDGEWDSFDVDVALEIMRKNDGA